MTDRSTPTPAEVLATPMEQPEFAEGIATIGQYLVRLLSMVWAEGEGFNGKRPFGFSGWHSDLYHALGQAGHVRYAEDAEGIPTDVDDAAADSLIANAIEHLRVTA